MTTSMPLIVTQLIVMTGIFSIAVSRYRSVSVHQMCSPVHLLISLCQMRTVCGARSLGLMPDLLQLLIRLI